MNRTASRFAAFLAIAALVLGGMRPLLAQSDADRGFVVPVCSVDGTIHVIEIEGGDTPGDVPAHEHCTLCGLSVERALPILLALLWSLPEGRAAPLSSLADAAYPSVSFTAAHPRGPPDPTRSV